MIQAWAERSEDMIGGAIEETVSILSELRAAGVPCYVLSNMEPETFPLRLERFDFLHWFDGHVISGVEGLVKPDPKIFRRMLRRFDLQPSRTLFIDDSAVNVEAAAKIGINAVRFESPSSSYARTSRKLIWHLSAWMGASQSPRSIARWLTPERTTTSGSASRACLVGSMRRAPRRIRHADLALEAVGVAEEDAQDLSEVGHEVVRRAAGHEPITNRLERLDRIRLQREVIDAATAEHRHLAIGFGVADHLEHVELGARPDMDDRHPHRAIVGRTRLWSVAEHLRVEHLLVEGLQPLGVVRQDGDVVEPGREHDLSIARHTAHGWSAANDAAIAAGVTGP